MNKKNQSIYLAGGFYSGWQDRLIGRVSQELLGPRSHQLVDSADYTTWDLQAIRRCDCLFAYFEASNPGKYALSLEMGYAKALGKFIILVDDTSPNDESVGKYTGMLHAISDVVFDSLEDGIIFVENLNG